MVHVAVYSGLRASELIGLRWSDVGEVRQPDARQQHSYPADQPAGRKTHLEFVNWRCLRTSYGTWLKRYGADMKDIQGQLRHSRISTTMDTYVQDIPESRRRAVDRLPKPTLLQ